MARRDAKSEPVTDDKVSDYGAGTAVDASKTPEEVENGTLGQEGSTGASKEESEKAGSFGLGFVQGYEKPVLLVPPQTADDTPTEHEGYES